jgi:hypothetical protein
VTFAWRLKSAAVSATVNSEVVVPADGDVAWRRRSAGERGGLWFRLPPAKPHTRPACAVAKKEDRTALGASGGGADLDALLRASRTKAGRCA